jgi:putative ABC transport system permease protein
LTFKLAFTGLRARRAQSLLCVIVVAAATTALTVSLAIGSVASRPYERTFAATNGAHVTVYAPPGGPRLDGLGRLPGVAAANDPAPIGWTAFDRDGHRYGLRVAGLGAELPAVSRPLLVDGDWPGPGEVVLERSLARFHRLHPGDTLSTPGGRLRVAGTVVVLAGEAYPRLQPGLALAPEATLRRIVPDPSRVGHVIGLRLVDPAQTELVAGELGRFVGRQGLVDTWLDDRDAASESGRVISVILSLFGMLLLLSSGAVLATLVGGRVIAQRRLIGTLKASGLTPWQVSRVLVVEQLALAVVGVVLGLAAGRFLTPLFTTPAASLLNASETPALSGRNGLLVPAVVLLLVALFAVVPALHAARRSTATVLTEGRSSGGRRSRLGRLADRLGLPAAVGVGVRGSFVRRGRTILTALALAVTVASVVATLGMEASLDVATDPGVAQPIEGFDTPRFDPVDDDAGEEDLLRPVVYSLDALLLIVGLVNLLATLLLTVRERVRDLGMLRAVGLTPAQVSGSLVSEQLVVAGIAGLAGLPLGLALFRLGVELSDGADEFAYPWWWALALLLPGLLLVVALLTAPLARRAASTTVATALRYE